MTSGFVYDSHLGAVEGQARPYIEGYRVTFIPYLRVKKLSSFQVDLAIGAGVTVMPWCSRTSPLWGTRAFTLALTRKHL